MRLGQRGDVKAGRISIHGQVPPLRFSAQADIEQQRIHPQLGEIQPHQPAFEADLDHRLVIPRIKRWFLPLDGQPPIVCRSLYNSFT